MIIIYPFTAAKVTVGNWLGVFVTIANPLTFVLINRLVLNLRQVSHVQEGNAPTLCAIGTIPEPTFATNSILGNIGAPLRVGAEDDYEIDEIDGDDEGEVIEECSIVNRTETIEEPRNPSYA
ncbi:hypothetical protein BD410DRAFT_795727 [Rickenella mellea]|uniref:Uncharacterized protein n=1 Tax=Rickenella mellea TaxID=50990 RepID=A0A4Y7PLI1_9AGAM|nr:hypothetical protein BD410DRAFT_795727 [Rickenella mellea]